MHFAAIQVASEADDALLVPRHSGWRADNCLSRMRAAHVQFSALPGRIREAPSLQHAAQRYLERGRAVGELQGWLRRRGGAIWGFDPVEGQLRLVFSRLRALFRVCPDFVVIATLRIIGNAWLTTRRMSRRPGGCVFGCMAVGGDCLRHYLGCPSVGRAIRRSRARPLCWIHTGHIALATLVIPLPPEKVYRLGAWNNIIPDASCTLCSPARLTRWFGLAFALRLLGPHRLDGFWRHI